MPELFYLAGEEGLWRLGGATAPPERLLSGPVSAFLEQGDCLFAGADNALLYSADGGRSWQAVLAEKVTALAASPSVPGQIVAGTQPAAIFRSEDGGWQWEEALTLRQFSAQEAWWLPVAPYEPLVRDLRFNPSRAAEMWAAVEMGGAVFSHDAGRSWQMRDYGLHDDVHRIWPDATDPMRLYAATGAGFFLSQSNGLNWDRVAYEMRRPYLVPLLCLPPWPQSDEEPVLLTAGARTPAEYWYDEEGALAVAYRSEDRGVSWLPITDGLGLDMPAMIVDFAASHKAPHAVFALGSDGVLWASRDRGLHWSVLRRNLPRCERLYVSGG